MKQYGILVALVLVACLASSIVLAGELSKDHLLSLSEILAKMEYLSETDQVNDSELAEMVLEAEDINMAWEYLEEVHAESLKPYPRLANLQKALEMVFDKQEANKSDEPLPFTLLREYSNLRKSAIAWEDNNANKLVGTAAGDLVESLLCTKPSSKKPLTMELVEKAHEEYEKTRENFFNTVDNPEKCHEAVENIVTYLGSEPIRTLNKVVFSDKKADPTRMRAKFDFYFCGPQTAAVKCSELKKIYTKEC